MVISASRRTDIPAFFSEWFFNRIREGYVIVRNPMNNRPSKILLTPELVDCIVFWTKNPIPMIPKLDELSDYSYYFQFTLTGYGHDIEKNVPDKKKDILPAFQRLSEKIGPEKVIWRYDPVMVNDRYTIDYHLHAFSEIAKTLKGYTEKAVFSFVDIYTKNQKAIRNLGIRDLTEEEMYSMARQFRDIASQNNMITATCAEAIDLAELSIEHNACIDKNLIERITGRKIKNTKKNLKDSGQRGACQCMASKEIGTHNTCGNGCIYCYANHSPESVKKNASKYDPSSPILCDSIRSGEEVKLAGDMKSLFEKDGQLSLFPKAT